MQRGFYRHWRQFKRLSSQQNSTVSYWINCHSACMLDKVISTLQGHEVIACTVVFTAVLVFGLLPWQRRVRPASSIDTDIKNIYIYGIIRVFDSSPLCCDVKRRINDLCTLILKEISNSHVTRPWTFTLNDESVGICMAIFFDTWLLSQLHDIKDSTPADLLAVTVRLSGPHSILRTVTWALFTWFSRVFFLICGTERLTWRRRLYLVLICLYTVNQKITKTFCVTSYTKFDQL